MGPWITPSDYRFSNNCISAKYCAIPTHHTSMESIFVQLLDDVFRRLRLVLWSMVTYEPDQEYVFLHVKHNLCD